MFYVMFAVHVLISLLLCVVVLIQQSKGGGLAGAFGSGGGEAMLGARGVTTFLHKATIYLGAAFMVSSLFLVVLSSRQGGSSGGSLSQQAADQVAPVATPVSPTPEGFTPAVPADGTTPVPVEGTPVEGGATGTGGTTGGDGGGTEGDGQ